MPKDFISMTTGQLGSYLKKEHGLILYPFAFYLHSVIRAPIGRERPKRNLKEGWNYPGWNVKKRRFMTKKELLELRSESDAPDPWEQEMNRAGLHVGESFRFDREVLRGLQKKVVNLRDKIIETAWDIEDQVYGVRREGKEGARKTALEWGAGELLCRLQSEYQNMSSWLLTLGRPPSVKTETACLWAELFRHEGLPVSWPLIADLMDWFLARLLPYENYQWVFGSEEISDPEYLKQKYHKQKERWRLIFEYRKSQEFTIEFPGLPRRRWLLVFGKTWDGFGIVLNADSREFHKADFSADMLEASRKVFQACPDMRCGLLLPDLTFSLVKDWVPKAG